MTGQVLTKRTTARAIISSSEFKRGFQDARDGVPFDWRDNRWNYERGRLFAHIAPLDMPLMESGGGLNPKAISLLEAAFKRSYVI
jgi:hypothetical protein